MDACCSLEAAVGQLKGQIHARLTQLRHRRRSPGNADTGEMYLSLVGELKFRLLLLVLLV